MSERLAFLFGVHNHQPAGNFEWVVAEAVARAYGPFLRAVGEVPGLALTVHCSGGLLAFLRERARPTFDLLGRLVADGRIELLTGGFWEPILPMLPDADKIGQIEALTGFLKTHFGVRPRGLWLAERVWEPGLPRALRQAGVEYVLLDDSHFALAGLDPERLGGYYLTDDQGATLAVFPISQRLRYLVPFADPGESVRYLEGRRGAGAVTLVDDGEKFGVWPGTDRLVYGERWLLRFFEALLGAPWLSVTTFSRYLDACPPSGRVYLPTAAYTELGEWALPAEAGAELEEARKRVGELPGGDRLARLLRGGSWRNFLVKYPEAGDTYWKMLGLSRRVQEALRARPADARVSEARERLWQGQANDAYWHGVFGGCYLPHLRRAVKSALVGCETLLDEAEDPGGALRWTHEDVNGDGRREITVATPRLTVTLNPERGGTITELAYRARTLDVADVLTRRREAYHARVHDRPAAEGGGEVRTIHAEAAAKEAGLAALLEYDRFRRASLLDALFSEGPAPDPLEPWSQARLVIGERPMISEARETAARLEVTLRPGRPEDPRLAVLKTVVIPRERAEIEITYRLDWSGAEILSARWGVQLNLALTAGDAPGRYFRAPGRPSLGGRGQLAGLAGLAMVDEWALVELGIEWDAPGEIAWAPIETVSLSETGFERIYQGSALLLSWPVRLEPGAGWQARMRLTLGAPRGTAPARGDFA
ncbi:MAG TPA: alpha-amylase/4-alpha-glucanotransferase domain-containing protein [Methylomirabilota bacterium]|nr:alpha-amylase/4-alpha-glucanotransferase domain-containing protein [Methylomirabilota bacterium]